MDMLLRDEYMVYNFWQWQVTFCVFLELKYLPLRLLLLFLLHFFFLLMVKL
jgi:hypothetical protein